MTPYQYSSEEKRRFPLWGIMLPFVAVIIAIVGSESARSALVKDLRTVPTPKAIDAERVTKIETPSDEGLEPMVPTAQIEFYPVGTHKIVTLKPKDVKPKPAPSRSAKAQDFAGDTAPINSENTDQQVDFAPYQEADLTAEEYAAEDAQPQETPVPTAKPSQNNRRNNLHHNPHR